MDPDLVRLLLVILGVLLVAGIYLWDRYKRGLAARPPRRRRERPGEDAVIESLVLDGDAGDDGRSVGDAPAATVPADRDAAASPPPASAGVASPAPADGPASHHDDWPVPDRDGQFSMDLSFGARGDEDPLRQDAGLPADVERKIVVINVAAKSGRFSGHAIETACARAGLEPGDMSIFHRRDPANGRRLFSMASMVEPGSFPFDDMQGFSTPGLTLFTQLPGARDGLAVYNDMVTVAEQLAGLLKGELRDERHNKLTRQMQEHTRESIVEHHRRVRLARSRH